MPSITEVSNMTGGNHRAPTQILANAVATFDLDLAANDWFDIAVTAGATLRIKGFAAGINEFWAHITATSSWSWSVLGGGSVNSMGNGFVPSNSAAAEAYFHFVSFDGGATWTYAVEKSGPVNHASAHGPSGTDTISASYPTLGVFRSIPPHLARAVSTSNIDVTTGGLLTIDGVTLVNNDLVLLTGQTTASQNGLWLAKTTGWIRPNEWSGAAIGNSTAPPVAGHRIWVQEGTTYAGTAWKVTTSGTITVDTTSVTITQDNASSGSQPALKAFASKSLNDGNQSKAASIAGFTAVDTRTDLVIPAAVGDVIEYAVSAWWAASTLGASLDVATMVSGAPVNMFSGTAAGGTDYGVAAWFASNDNIAGDAVGGPAFKTLTAADISNGTVTLRLYQRVDGSSGARTLFVNAGAPLIVYAKNLGQAGVASGQGAPALKSFDQAFVTSTITLNSTTWADVPQSGGVRDLVLQNPVAGDVVELAIAARFEAEAINAFLDVVTMNGSTPINSVGRNGGAAPTGAGGTTYGIRGWAGGASVAADIGSPVSYVIQQSDIISGKVTFRLRYFTGTAGNKTLYAQATDGGVIFSVKSFGIPGVANGLPWSIDNPKANVDTPDDEFNATTLAAKWTVAAGTLANGIMSNILRGSSDYGKYDLSTIPGRLLASPGNTSQCRFRQSYTLPDGRSIVAKFRPSVNGNPVATASDQQLIGLALNTDTTSPWAGTRGPQVILDAVPANAATPQVPGWKFTNYDGTTTVGALASPVTPVTFYAMIVRSGLVYYSFVSFDGETWHSLGSQTKGAAQTVLWIAMENIRTEGPLPIMGCDWVREGAQAIRPW